MRLKYLSVCSGIEAASAAWQPLGWEAVAFSEIEPFPCAVLKYRFPDVPNLGDMTRVDGSQFRGEVDILVGGTPCQAFSVAGERGGLTDTRGNLALKFVELADAVDSQFVVWENVPGVLSMRDNAFGHLLGGLAGESGPIVAPGERWANAGYVLGPKRTIAWRVLDAQYFGVPQRRRRVFVVGCPSDGLDPREILFEQESVRRNTPPCRKAEATAAIVAQGSANAPIAQPNQVSGTLCASGAGMSRPSGNANGPDFLVLNQQMRLRRLTPVECERLQGFPDGWTDVPYKGKQAPDHLRYKAIGNSMCVNVMAWLGRRINKALRTRNRPLCSIVFQYDSSCSLDRRAMLVPK